MLPDNVKTQIRAIYKDIATALPNFVPRREQNFMVAEISKTLAGEYDKDRRIIVVEAGTGIGKSLSYILGTIPLALASKKSVHCHRNCRTSGAVATQRLALLSGTIGFEFSVWFSERSATLCLSFKTSYAGW